MIREGAGAGQVKPDGKTSKCIIREVLFGLLLKLMKETSLASVTANTSEYSVSLGAWCACLTLPAVVRPEKRLRLGGI